ncbi:MAG: hypothetical protein ACOC3Z_02580 [Nanoarchaeota archaeon]
MSYYIPENNNKINNIMIKFKKTNELLNIYNRINKLELKREILSNKEQINILDIIKLD